MNRRLLSPIAGILLVASVSVGCGGDEGIDEPTTQIGGSAAPAATPTSLTAIQLIRHPREFALVTDPTGSRVLPEPDRNQTDLGVYTFGSIVSVVAETVDPHGARWRLDEGGGWIQVDELRPDDRGTVTRVELMPVYRTAQAAGRAAVDLQLVASPDLASVVPEFRPRASAPVRSGSAGPPLAVVVAPGGARAFDIPAGGNLASEILQPGALVAIYQQGFAPSADPWVKVDGGWIPARAVSTFGTTGEAVEAAIRHTVGAVSPGGEIHPELRAAVLFIDRSPEFRYLARFLRDEHIPVLIERLPRDADPGTIALYDFSTRVIVVNERWASVDHRAVAAALVHEATHAWEHKQGLRPVAGEPCYQAELRAFHNQTRLWESFFGPQGKPHPTNDAETELNAIQQAFRSDPEVLKRAIVDRYRAQCEQPTGR